MPSDAYSVSRSREQRSTKKVADGQECHTKDVDRGNGTFERKNVCETKYKDEPIYDDKCRFTVDRWRHARDLKEAGGLRDAPRWPQVSLKRAGTCVGCEREGAHAEQYQVVLVGEPGTKWECDKPQSEWKAFPLGKKYPLKVGVVTGLADCSSLSP
jgi:hypothetical protein